MVERISPNRAADELHRLIDSADLDTLAELYQHAFAYAETVYPDDETDELVVDTYENED